MTKPGGRRPPGGADHGRPGAAEADVRPAGSQRQPRREGGAQGVCDRSAGRTGGAERRPGVATSAAAQARGRSRIARSRGKVRPVGPRSDHAERDADKNGRNRSSTLRDFGLCGDAPGERLQFIPVRIEPLDLSLNPEFDEGVPCVRQGSENGVRNRLLTFRHEFGSLWRWEDRNELLKVG
jgi:hypothetical protein